MLRDIDWVLHRLRWMRERRIWPNGKRYLWTDAFGVVLLVSLYRELHEEQYLAEAEWIVSEVDRVLGRPRGVRIGEAADRDGQYFHYLAMWVYALDRLGRIKPEYRRKAIDLVKQIHPAFVIPGRGIWWKMQEDLSGPYPGYGLGGLDPFQGYVTWKLLDPEALRAEIWELKTIVDHIWPGMVVTQDLGLGMMLWHTHFVPEEEWARAHREQGLRVLNRMWIDPPGYFCRQPELPHVKFAFTNYGVSVGLQAVDAWPERVHWLNGFFESYRAGDEYDTEAITWVMACNSHFPGELLKPAGAAAGATAAAAR